MANIVVTAKSSDIRQEARMEPKLFIFKETLSQAKMIYQFVTIESIAGNIARGQSPKPSTYKDKCTATHNFIRTVDVKKHQTASEATVYVEDSVYKCMKSNRIIPGDLLISVVGNYLGSTTVVPDSIKEGLYNDNSARIRVNDKSISPYYLSAFFNSTFGQLLIHSKATRTGQKILSAGNVKKLEVPIINNEQVSELLKEAAKKEDLANELIFNAQSICRRLFESILMDIRAEKYFSVNKSFFVIEDLWTPKYSYPLYVKTTETLVQNFDTTTIGEIADLIKGDEVGSDNYIGYTDRKDSDVPFIRTTDVVNYDLDLYPDFFIPYEVYTELDQGFMPSDILFTKDGKIGVVAMVTNSDKSIIGSGFSGIRLNENAKKLGITPEYLFTLLTIREIGIYESKRRSVYASTIPHLREERLKEIRIPIISNDLINIITEKIRKAFLLKSEKKQLIQKAAVKMDSYLNIV